MLGPIPTFEQFIQRVSENFRVEDDVLYFDPLDKTPNVDTSFFKGRRPRGADPGSAIAKYLPRTTTLDGKYTVISAYSRLEAAKGSDLMRDVQTSIKGKGPYKLDRASYEKFVERTAEYLRACLGHEPFEVLVTIESSSELSDDVTKALLRRLGPKTEYIKAGVIKNHEIETIRIAQDPRVTDAIRKVLLKSIAKALETGYFKIQNVGMGQWRKFMENWLVASEKLVGHIEGKRVVIMDDYLTSGSSMLESIRAVELFNPKEIQGVTIMK